MAAVAEQGHADTLPDTPLTPDPVSVTMPGQHIGPYKTPAKESDPRILGPLFYDDQEDFLAEWSARNARAGPCFAPTASSVRALALR